LRKFQVSRRLQAPPNTAVEEVIAVKKTVNIDMGGTAKTSEMARAIAEKAASLL
jgi:isocitrate/isopropylmalate dehydrogenase